MKHLIFFIDGTKIISVYYMETHSLYFEKKQWDKLIETGFVGVYGNGGMFYVLFSALKLHLYNN